ncbi:MAG: STN domain-containing protein [Paludibacter sp.]
MKKTKFLVPLNRNLKKLLLTMKLCLLFLLISAASLMANSGYSQNTTLSIHLKNATLRDLISEVEKQSEFIFVFYDKVVDLDQKIDVNVEGQTIDKILDKIFKSSELTYRICDRQIGIGKRDPVTGIIELPATLKELMVADKKITGMVKDVKGEPIPGVTVIVKGTTIGTITDSQGKFSLDVPLDAKTLLFSFVGMKSREIVVDGKTTINVVMVEETLGLEEVVAIGYATQKKASVTGAISSVGSVDLVRSPNASVANTLAGRVTGLTTVQYSGRPGGDDPVINVRGIGSLTSGASSPLILVDGVERSFTQLDPNEIESVSVLKDASATAVFGVRGANGVILVTTKRGFDGATKISFTSTSGFQSPLRVPAFVDSYTHAMMYNEAQTNDDPNAVVKFSPTAIEAFRTNSDPIIYPNTNWNDYILKPAAFQTQENMNISGGTKTVKYFVSLGYLKQDGLFRTFDLGKDFNYAYNRYNYRANLDIDVTKTTKLSLTTGGRSEIRNEPLQDEPQFSIWRNIYFAQPYRGVGIVDGKHIMSDPRYI